MHFASLQMSTAAVRGMKMGNKSLRDEEEEHWEHKRRAESMFPQFLTSQKPLKTATHTAHSVIHLRTQLVVSA
ncbi:uncharacterized [Tachysurus ichikawai]